MIKNRFSELEVMMATVESQFASRVESRAAPHTAAFGSPAWTTTGELTHNILHEII